MGIGFVAGDEVLLLVVQVPLQKKPLVNHALKLFPHEFHGLAHTAGKLFQSNMCVLSQSLQIDLIPADPPQGTDAAAQERPAANQGSQSQGKGDGCKAGPGGDAHQVKNTGNQCKRKSRNGRNSAKDGFQDSLCRLSVGTAVECGQIVFWHRFCPNRLHRNGFLRLCGTGHVQRPPQGIGAGAGGPVNGARYIAAQLLIVLRIDRFIDDFLNAAA